MINLKVTTPLPDTQLQCLIVEDQATNLSYLKRILRYTCPEVNVVAESGSIQETLEILHSSGKNLDLAFLDIYLTDGLVFKAIPDIKKNGLEFVFCTAYDEHSMKAWNLNAAHYLTKPVDPESLRESVNRVLMRKAIQPQPENDPDALKETVILSDKNNNFLVKHNEIANCNGENNSTDIWLESNRRITITKTLKTIVNLLPAKAQFYRIHKSHLINLHHLDRLVYKNDAHHVLMKNGKKLPVARRRVKYFKEYLNNWRG